MTRRRTQAQVAELRANIIEMNEAGATVDVIARELEISIPYVYGLLRELDMRPTAVKRPTSLDKYSEEDIERLKAAYLNGETILPLLNEIGMSYTVFYTMLFRAGIPMRDIVDEKKMVRQRIMDLAVSMYEQGASLYSIKMETGIDQPRLHAELHQRGVELRRGITKKKRTRKDAIVDTTDPEPLDD